MTDWHLGQLHFAHAQPANVILLIDTYDTEAAACKLVSLAPRLQEKGIAIKGVRLDSGDLAVHARRVRKILDEGGLTTVTIFCSGDLDEYLINKLLVAGAPIDGFGIGTRLDTSIDVPAIDCVYKLQEYAGIPRRKRSEGKVTWPGRKQIYRCFTADGTLAGDCLALEDYPQPGEALLKTVMHGGKRVAATESLDTLRERVKRQLACLPSPLRTLQTAPPYPVDIAPELLGLSARLKREGR